MMIPLVNALREARMALLANEKDTAIPGITGAAIEAADAALAWAQSGGVDEGLLDRIIELFRTELYAAHEHDDRTLPIQITGWEDVRPDLRALLFAPPQPWQVKDFADGWIDVPDEEAARRLSEEQSGAAIRPRGIA